MPVAPALLETQRRFLAALYDDDAAGPMASIAGNGLEPEARLRIYRRSSHAIQTDALRTTYPAVLALVGEAFFEQTAAGYRRAYPSRSGNLQAFGEHFAEYLAGVPAVDTVAYLPDVARLEWLRQESALAGSADALPAQDLALILHSGGGSSRIGLHPSVRLLASRFPVLTIWRYAMQPESERLQLPDVGEQVMLWRDGGQVALAALDPASFACIEALAQHRTLDDAAAAGRLHDAEFDFAVCTRSLADRGLLVMGTSIQRIS